MIKLYIKQPKKAELPFPDPASHYKKHNPDPAFFNNFKIRTHNFHGEISLSEIFVAVK